MKLRLYATKSLITGDHITVAGSENQAWHLLRRIIGGKESELPDKGFAVVPVTLFEGHLNYALLQDIGPLPPHMPEDDTP